MRGHFTQEVCILEHSEFPPLLKEISDPPKQLYIRGVLPAEKYRWLTVVGSRTCTAYGKQVVEYLIHGLKGYPVVVVSGLALGIDALAHRAALSAGLPTVAIPGSGINWDVLYPQTHITLAREIIKSGGALLSEYKPDTPTALWAFPRRNRIMAGISHATLLVEAREKSGTLITAKLAAQYNRDLLVVPGSIFSDTSAGCHQFLKLGATPITKAADLLQALNLAQYDSSESRAQILPADISPAERDILKILANPIPRAQLVDTLDMPITEVNILLSTMEIKGLIEEKMGVMITR